jgi:hypothetical protein
VSDRFGDYGLVGVVLYEAAADRYKVDTLLLSCRVLGRGVEHALLAWLGRRAVEEGKRLVELAFVPTTKNLPALQFLESIADARPAADRTSWTVGAERLATLAYNPDDSVRTAAPLEPRPPRPAGGFGVADPSGRLQRIAEHLYDVEQVTRAIDDYRLRKDPLPAAPPAAPRSPLQAALVHVWSKVLGTSRIGLHDNFFDAGGTSLRAVQVIAMIRKELKRDLSIVALFESPTVALLAARLSAGADAAHGGAAAAEAALRGRQRRYNVSKRAS